MTMEYEVAKQLFEMVVPLQGRIADWEHLPEETHYVWMRKAESIINIIESYCPLSPKYDIVKVRS